MLFAVLTLILHPPDFSYSFYEKFDARSVSKRWIPSESRNYTGIWEVDEPDPPLSHNGEKLLILRSKNTHSAVSAVFDQPIFNINRTLVIQYEMRPTIAFTCSGAYIKLFSGSGFDTYSLTNETEYTLLFGPDRCSTMNKIRFIFSHWNPKKKLYEKIQLKDPPQAPTDNLNHLYTLIIRPNNTFSILLDNKVIKDGSLFFGFEPPVVPRTQIPDPQDRKPDDWEEIPYIVDPQNQKPQDWDDSKGTWKPSLIPNPKYKGEWKPQLIKNPEFYYDPEPYKLQPITAIGFEIWATNKDLSFGKILIAYDEDRVIQWNRRDFLMRKQFQIESIERGLKKQDKPLKISLKSSILSMYHSIIQSIFPIEVSVELIFVLCALSLPIFVAAISKKYKLL